MANENTPKSPILQGKTAVFGGVENPLCTGVPERFEGAKRTSQDEGAPEAGGGAPESKRHHPLGDYWTKSETTGSSSL